jgi:hypothetical protein
MILAGVIAIFAVVVKGLGNENSEYSKCYKEVWDSARNFGMSTKDAADVSRHL